MPSISIPLAHETRVVVETELEAADPPDVSANRARFVRRAAIEAGRVAARVAEHAPPVERPRHDRALEDVPEPVRGRVWPGRRGQERHPARRGPEEMELMPAQRRLWPGRDTDTGEPEAERPARGSEREADRGPGWEI